METMNGSAKIKVHTEAHQVLLVSNPATTGHKLQGYAATSLLVDNFVYQQHWLYVILLQVELISQRMVESKLGCLCHACQHQ